MEWICAAAGAQESALEMATRARTRKPTTKPTPRPAQVVQWTPEQIDAIASETNWFPLGPDLDSLIAHVPQTSKRCERTTVLTWAYQMSGLIGFRQIWERMTGYHSERAARKHTTSVLRTMLAHQLITRIHFPAEGGSKSADGINEGSAFELTTRGMVWLAHAWTARRNLARMVGVVTAHEVITAEEDDGKGYAPHYVGPVSQAKRVRPVSEPPAGNFVFSLGAAAKARAR